jgi:hypothetical protein
MFQPAMRVISSITRGNPTIVATGLVDGTGIVTPINHRYSDGIIIRLDVPLIDGMSEIDGMTGEITVTSATTFTIPIDSTSFTPFAIPLDTDPSYSPHRVTCALAVPISENNNQITNAVHNIYG